MFKQILHSENYLFESSCATVNWSLAETACVKKGTAIFNFSDVATSIGSLALRKAQAEHGTIWVNMDINGNIVSQFPRELDTFYQHLLIMNLSSQR